MVALAQNGLISLHLSYCSITALLFSHICRARSWYILSIESRSYQVYLALCSWYTKSQYLLRFHSKWGNEEKLRLHIISLKYLLRLHPTFCLFIHVDIIISYTAVFSVRALDFNHEYIQFTQALINTGIKHERKFTMILFLQCIWAHITQKSWHVLMQECISQWLCTKRLILWPLLERLYYNYEYRSKRSFHLQLEWWNSLCEGWQHHINFHG